MRASAIASALAAAALLPPGARAATVDLDDFENGTVYVQDTRGEQNRLTVGSGLNSVTVREAGVANLRAVKPCRRRSAKLVECPAADRVYIDAGRGDDSVTFSGGAGEIHAGAGDDAVSATGSFNQLFGDAGDDVLRGGDKADDLSGGRGEDRLIGGLGDDILWGEGLRDPTSGAGFRGSGDDDVLDGGKGHDLASWAERRDGVTADLRMRRGGGPGERDSMRSIESLSGGVGNDRLTGDGKGNALLGSNGRDVLTGGGGSDALGAGTGSALFSDGTDGARDRLDCGSGNDRVDSPGLDPLPGDCELMGGDPLGSQGLSAQPFAQPTNRFLFETVCNGSMRGCRRRIVLVHDGVEIGRSDDVEMGAAQTARIPVQLAGPLPSGLIEVRHEGVDDNYGEPLPHLFRYRLSR